MNELPTGARDFDWYFGAWHVHNRMLRKRLADSNDWWEFPATDVVKPILGGLGNIVEKRTIHGLPSRKSASHIFHFLDRVISCM